jgi:hypothetical protein
LRYIFVKTEAFKKACKHCGGDRLSGNGVEKGCKGMFARIVARHQKPETGE